MKQILLFFFYLGSVTFAAAQSKTTGVVNLMTGMTAQLELNSTTSTATLTLAGPSDRWFALQIGSFAGGGGMQAGQDVVYYNGTTLVDAVHNGVGSAPSADAVNNWTVTSNTVSGSTRTIVATRAFSTGSTQDYTIVYSDTSIDFAYARGETASYTLAYHGTNKGYALNKAYTCIAPPAPTAAAQQFCSGATVGNLSVTGAAGATFSWYTAPTGGTALGAGTVLSNGNYYVSQTVSACESTRTMVAVTINTVNAPAASAQTVCGGATIANLNVTGVTGAIFTWYDAVSGGNVLSTNTELSTGSYYVSQTVGECESPRTTVAVTVFDPEGPTASDQAVCEGATVADLEATGSNGSNLSWYTDAAGGSPLAANTVLAAGDYYVSQTTGTCESGRTMVMVTINPVPDAPTGNATQQFTDGETIAGLEITTETGAVVTWYMNVGGDIETVPVATLLADDTMYMVTQAVNGCESDFLIITADEVLGTASFSNNLFSVYPNPVADELNIKGTTGIAAVAMYNLLGQEVISLKPGKENVMINTSGLTAGMYIIKVISVNGETTSLRVVKE